jgi:hypothetical protein
MPRYVALGLLCVMALFGCESGTPDETFAPEDVAQSADEIRIGDYYDPPRCSPRNCVAMCATCYYDICRIGGASQADCAFERELCKDECYPGTCVPGDPGCPCTNPTDPNCI